MGISGLLPLLKSIQKPCSLKKFSGQTIGVDAYGWLHRGVIPCAMDLAMGKPTTKYVDFAMHRVRMLNHYGVTPYLVFDGDYLPSKAATETDRARRREESRLAGLELLKAGKTSQAYLEFQKAIDVTPEMARELIEALKKSGVQYVVAPYEADAQMVYLERKGLVAGILSEDSDLLVFGAKCLLTKLDQYGNCIEINKADFSACREITLTGWSDREFRQMAILSGCDYLASITNMGLKTAYRMVRKHKTVEKVVRMLQFDGKYHVPKGYLEDFYRAEHTFLHQRVYCPITKRITYHVNPDKPIDDTEMPFIGAFVEPETAREVATGLLHPMTKEPIILSSASDSRFHNNIPWMRDRQRPSQITATSDLKKGVPINQFFKPRRVPLAELDPNAFSHSPSQQEALRRNSGPWAAAPAPRPYLNRSITEPQAPQSAPAPVRISAGRSLSVTSATSEPRPKRARLCAGGTGASLAGPDAVLSSSPFFQSAAPEPSPLAARSKKSRRSKKEDIVIFSDDSIEEAMLSLPDTGINPMPNQSNNIDSEGRKGPSYSQSGSKDGLNALVAPLEVTRSLNNSQLATSRLTQSTSMASSTECPPTPPSMSTTKKTFQAPAASAASLKEKFGFKSITTITTTTTAEPSTAATITTPRISHPVRSFSIFANQLPPTPPSSSARSSRIPLARSFSTSSGAQTAFAMTETPTPNIAATAKADIKVGSGSGSGSSIGRCTTPLQRLGSSALGKKPLLPPPSSSSSSSSQPSRSSFSRLQTPQLPRAYAQAWSFPGGNRIGNSSHKSVRSSSGISNSSGIAGGGVDDVVRACATPSQTTQTASPQRPVIDGERRSLLPFPEVATAAQIREAAAAAADSAAKSSESVSEVSGVLVMTAGAISGFDAGQEINGATDAAAVAHRHWEKTEGVDKGTLGSGAEEQEDAAETPLPAETDGIGAAILSDKGGDSVCKKHHCGGGGGGGSEDLIIRDSDAEDDDPSSCGGDGGDLRDESEARDGTAAAAAVAGLSRFLYAV